MVVGYKRSQNKDSYFVPIVICPEQEAITLVSDLNKAIETYNPEEKLLLSEFLQNQNVSALYIDRLGNALDILKAYAADHQETMLKGSFVIR